MASESRVRGGDGGDEDDRSAGGKLLRTRRRMAALAASPYYRKEEGSPALVSPKTKAKGWFSGIGRFFTSVFGSESGSDSSCSCTSGSDPDEPDEVDYKDGLDGDANVMDEAGIRSFENQEVGHQLPASSSKTKMLIEKLLQQETYSRDESKKLIEMIQSRVEESPAMDYGKNGMGEDFSSRTNYGVTSSPRILGSMFPHKLLGRSPDSPSYLSTLYSSSFADQVCTPNSTNVAIIEAKKWVEDKRLSNTKSGLSCGPCALNTDPFYHEYESNKESPVVDIAKSYMQAVPPWRSPISSGAGFRAPSTATLKRYQLDAAMRGAHNVAWDMHQKLDAASSSVLGKTGLSKESLDLEPFHNSSATCEKDVCAFGAVLDSNTPQNKGSSDKTENVKDDRPDAVPNTDEAGGTKHSLPRNNETSNERENTCDNNVMALKESLQVVSENSAILSPSEAKVVDMEEPSPLKAKAGSITVHETSVVEYNGDLVEGALNAEPIAVVPGKISSSARYGASDKIADSRGTGNEKHKATSGGGRRDVSIPTFNAMGEASMEVIDGSERIAEEGQPDITIKPIKRTLRGLPPNSSRGRGRNSVKRVRRSRGK